MTRQGAADRQPDSWRGTDGFVDEGSRLGIARTSTRKEIPGCPPGAGGARFDHDPARPTPFELGGWSAVARSALVAFILPAQEKR
jgi:hypothetical protein